MHNGLTDLSPVKNLAYDQQKLLYFPVKFISCPSHGQKNNTIISNNFYTVFV